MNALDLIEKYFIFGVIDRLNFEQKKLLISNVLTENIKRGGKVSTGEENSLENIIFIKNFMTFQKACIEI